jgi:putative holliday junction resolvase
MSNNNKAVIALDVGTIRVGVAWADGTLRMPFPLVTLPNDSTVFQKINALYHDQFASQVVVGLPRNQQGEETAQSAYAREFAKKLEKYNLPIAFQDESLTSVLAERELKERGKPYTKEDIDSLAATFILQDFLEEHKL